MIMHHSSSATWLHFSIINKIEKKRNFLWFHLNGNIFNKSFIKSLSISNGHVAAAAQHRLPIKEMFVLFPRKNVLIKGRSLRWWSHFSAQILSSCLIENRHHCICQYPVNKFLLEYKKIFVMILKKKRKVIKISRKTISSNNFCTINFFTCKKFLFNFYFCEKNLQVEDDQLPSLSSLRRGTNIHSKKFHRLLFTILQWPLKSVFFFVKKADVKLVSDNEIQIAVSNAFWELRKLSLRQRHEGHFMCV